MADPLTLHASTLQTDPISRWVQDLLSHAHRMRASDVHLEPLPNDLCVRLRIDGHLSMYPSPNPSWRDRIISKFKVLSRMDIAEKRLPQDGRLQWTVSGISLGLRISSIPTLNGEKLVLRLLPTDQKPRSLNTLGFSSEQLNQVQRALASPHGLILVTGPTGSGKSATLMAHLQSLDHQSLNITTVEDPVEQVLKGINQIGINEKIGLDFPTTLRALLRQDPDVLLVGEIRDLSTAMVAAQAAQTGHLVLSTLHTNTAVSAVLRLRHMGVPADHLAACLRMVCAQRLVRLLCVHCKFKRPNGSWHAQGCEHCHGGFWGRQAIHEIVPVTHALANLILSNADAHALELSARQQGFKSMADAAQILVEQGLTTQAEIDLAVQGDAS
jgi:type II secretory ATPase GspE/PulE/Tfp pilus assembly ATPase PilB-like protein